MRLRDKRFVLVPDFRGFSPRLHCFCAYGEAECLGEETWNKVEHFIALGSREEGLEFHPGLKGSSPRDFTSFY
jgi:hypothetical protein